MISGFNSNQLPNLSAINDITITSKTSNTNYGGSDLLNNVIIMPNGKLSITDNAVANKTIAEGTTNSASGMGAYFYVNGGAKSNNATIENNGFLNIGENRNQEYKNGHWVDKPLSEQLTKNKAYATNTHLLKGGNLWTGINSVTKGTINEGGVLNEYYGKVYNSINTEGGREYTYSPVVSSNSKFNRSYDYVGLQSKKGGTQNNVTAENHSLINVTNSGYINKIKSTDSTINSNNKGTINNIESHHSIINVNTGGVISNVTATNNSIINNNNSMNGKNTLTNSTLNANSGSKADTVTLNGSLINVNGTSTISNIISNNNNNTISFPSKKPVTLNSNSISGDYTVKISSNLNNFSTDLINVKNGISGNLKLNFSGLGKTGRNTLGNGIKIINNENLSSNHHITMTKPINRGILVYNLKNIDNDYYLQSSLNKVNYINVYTPLALSDYSLSNTGSLYQRQGSFINTSKHDVWVKYNSKKTKY
ncbi:hypothetical protein AYY22_18245 [Photobacterium kishitanii]|uniref:hypothetical protein n=1 Tax=Photobacterium kishitanii TaxID=318456 RepID=UPI0007EFE039|nr:hypothetical protein [Photobacterium kishitanii]OBU26621.1 hypothetical protein AYY22_18245 [Photobacterium kishitanii]